MSPGGRAKQATARVVNAHRGRARRVPKTEATDWLRGNRHNKTLLRIRRVLLLQHCCGEAPEWRSWVSKREDSRAGFARLTSLTPAFLQRLQRFTCEHLLITLLLEGMLHGRRFRLAMLD